MVAAYGADDFPKRPYWRRWDGGAVTVAMASIYVLYAITGVAVAGLAQHLGWEVLSSGSGREWANGAAFGIAAAGLFKLEITGFKLIPIAPARNLLNLFLQRFERSLDVGANRGVARKVGDLTPRQLCQVSWQLFLRHVRPKVSVDVAVADARRLRALHAQALTPLEAADALMAADIAAQEVLRYYIEQLIVGNRDATIDFREDEDVPLQA